MYSNVTALAYFGVELFVASCIFAVATLLFYLAYHVISNTLDTFTQVLYMRFSILHASYVNVLLMLICHSLPSIISVAYLGFLIFLYYPNDT